MDITLKGYAVIWMYEDGRVAPSNSEGPDTYCEFHTDKEGANFRKEELQECVTKEEADQFKVYPASLTLHGVPDMKRG